MKLEHLELRRLLSAVNTNILVVYNAGFTGDLDRNGVQDSLQVANYYALKRGVPAANLLGVNPVSATSLSYADYKTQVAQPVQNKLLQLGENNITYILMIYGMPWKVGSDYSLDNYIVSPEYSLAQSNVFSTGNPYLERNPLYSPSGVYDGGASDRGHFDHSYTLSGGHTLYLVSRLDGPVDSALGISRITNLIDSAIYAEKYISTAPGYLNGKLYVTTPTYTGNSFPLPTTDNDIKTGNYGSIAGAQKNTSYAARYAELFGVPWADAGAQNNNAFLYSGMQNYHYLDRQIQWLPGGTGVDLNSITLNYDIRRAFLNAEAWGTQALADGITGVLGVTSEPFVSGHQRPNIFNYYLMKGFTFGEAASLSTASVGWREMAIGDPLYAPFAPKTNVLDNVAPVFVTGYPKIDWVSREGYVVDVLLDDQASPEAARVKVDFGLTTAYGQTKELKQYYLRHRLSLGDLQAGQTYHARVTVTDPAGNVTVSPDITFQTAAQTPYGGTAWAVPGMIQFENFDVGGEGIAYHDTEPQDIININNPRPNEGVEVTYFTPTSVWQIKAGEWLEYTINVAQTGMYTLEVNSQADAAGNQFHLEVDGVNVSGALSSPSGGLGITKKMGIQLIAGTRVVRVRFDNGVGDGWVGSFDWFKFSPDTVTPPPTPATVTGVYARGTTWATAFLDFIASSNQGDATLGFKIPVGSSAQLNSLPWTNVNQLSVKFSSNVTITQEALSLIGINTANYASSNFAYDSTTRVATWTFTNALLPDKLLLTLNSALITNAPNNPLDGEWTDTVSTVSGNGTAGGNFAFRLNVLPGDVDGSQAVNLVDTLTTRSKQALVSTSPGYSIFFDINAGGSINLIDTLTVRSNQATVLPSGEPTLSAPLSADLSVTLAAPLSSTTTSNALLSSESLIASKNSLSLQPKPIMNGAPLPSIQQRRIMLPPLTRGTFWYGDKTPHLVKWIDLGIEEEA